MELQDKCSDSQAPAPPATSQQQQQRGFVVSVCDPQIIVSSLCCVLCVTGCSMCQKEWPGAHTMYTIKSSVPTPLRKLCWLLYFTSILLMSYLQASDRPDYPLPQYEVQRRYRSRSAHSSLSSVSLPRVQ